MELVCVGNMITVDLYFGVIIKAAIDEITAAIIVIIINCFLHL
jgi:hypothetical protein